MANFVTQTTHQAAPTPPSTPSGISSITRTHEVIVPSATRYPLLGERLCHGNEVEDAITLTVDAFSYRVIEACAGRRRNDPD
jgi:hypothetical protein